MARRFTASVSLPVPVAFTRTTQRTSFSILKRGVIGTYHHWSQAHMHRYLAEFDFRYSHKNVTDKERADVALKGARLESA